MYYSKKNLDDIKHIYGFEFNDNNTYNSFFDEPVKKVHYRSIKSKNEIVKLYPNKVYMTDVSPAVKYILDNNLSWCIFPKHIELMLFGD